MTNLHRFIFLFLLAHVPPRRSQASDPRYDWGKITAGIRPPNPASSQLPGWQCQVCEDVAATWRETFQCAGTGDNGIAPMVSDHGVSCTPSANCQRFEGVRKAMCLDLKAAFRQSSSTNVLITDGIVDKEDPYQTCVTLGKCDAQSSAVGATCYKGLHSANCVDDINCEKNPRYLTGCSDACFVCYWVVRSWPVFKEICAQTAGGSPLPPQQTANTAGDGRRRRRLLDAQQQKPFAGLGSAPISPQPKSARSTEDLGKACYETWDAFEKSSQARFLCGMTDQLGEIPWNANTVCKCLKLCSYDQFESISLMNACDWAEKLEDSDEIKRSVFPDLIS